MIILEIIRLILVITNQQLVHLQIDRSIYACSFKHKMIVKIKFKSQNTFWYIYKMEKSYGKAERTRNFIIEKTADIFNRKGYAGTSLNDLTEATGLTKGSIYGNFENKEEVALAAFDYNLGQVNLIIQQKINKSDNYYNKLLASARVYDQFTKSAFPKGGCPILNTAIEADDTHELLKARATKAILGWKKNLQDLMQAGVDAGEFKKDFDHAQLALSIIALIEGGVMIAKLTNSQSSLDKIVMTIEGLINDIRR